MDQERETSKRSPASETSRKDRDPAIRRMQALIQEWEEIHDPKAIFLECYLMMTNNMLEALEDGEFNDARWVNGLLHRFANYYFDALDAYEQHPEQAPGVWQLAFEAARQPRTLALQNLLLGVNAHINYDLVLALEDLLQKEWGELGEEGRRRRYADHCNVNDVITRTIDAVQDQVLERETPAMDIIDRLLGPLDERIISHLLSDWRDAVWENASRLLESGSVAERDELLREIEGKALRLGEMIRL